MSDSNIVLSALHNDHKIGNFGNYHDIESKDLLKIKELKNLSIFQIAKFKSSNVKTETIKIDNLDFPQSYPNVSFNNETRILWTGPDICLVVSSDKNIKSKIVNSVNEEDFATTDISHSRAGIEICGKHAIDILKKGSPLNLNGSEFKKNNCANSSYNGISFTVDFVDDVNPTFRLFCLRSFGGSFYHSITDAALEYGYAGE
ncbi:MAG: sarcosine oxidase [Alphaproteobacteria bacterium]|nr:sarcosine oxidase [Alphaproteobacteria bacterium]